VRRAALEPGQTVLVIGAGGEVGTAAVQVAALSGARVLAATSGSAKQEAALDYTMSDPWERALALTGGLGVDAVVDNSGTRTLSRSLGALRVGGSLLVVGCVTGSAVPDFDVRQLYVRHLAILGSSNGTRADLRRVLDLMAAGRLRPPEPELFALDQVRQVHELVESGRRSQRSVLLPSS
jgi:NADPH:quinone reductase-like Zn-dependent oxidoreductase